MGLLKAGIGAAGGVLADSWRDYFYCTALNATTLAAKGEKRVTERGSNTKGEPNIISDGSVVAVNDGQCMLVVDQGKVVEVCAEPGEFVYDASSEPSVFYGSLGESIMATFAKMGERFAFGGSPATDQRVYYVNTKEILGNKYGTPTPVPFRVVDANIGLDMDIAVRCNGEYSYRIADPLLFYQNVCGNFEGTYTRDRIDSQMRSELLTQLQPAFARISAMGIRYSAVPGHTAELAQILGELLSVAWTERRGISIVSFGMNSIATSPEDEQAIKELQRAAVLRDPAMAAANLTAAQGDAMRAAATNENGAMMGFMGLGMANAAGGTSAQSLFQMSQQPAPQPAAPVPPTQPAAVGAAVAGGWACPACGTPNTGKFCQECGTPRPQPHAVTWACPSCGTQNTGRFCQECGTPRP